MKDVIVIGGDHHNTLAILRSLGEKGLKVNLIVVSSDKKPYVCYSRYIARSLVIRTEEEIKKAMYALHSSNDKDIVIACSDVISSFLDLNHEELSADFILPGAKKQGTITRLMNKEVMSQIACECRITIPKSWIVERSLPIIDEVEYPCIVKPLVSKEGTKADISICSDRNELVDYLKRCQCERLQIQKYIVKDIEYQLIGCSINGGQEVIIPGASVLLRQPKNTNTGFLRYIPKRNFLFDFDACQKFLTKTGYSGLFSMEFLRDKDGHDYFMEINFRNDGNSICVTASGMNLPYIWVLYNSGKDFSRELDYANMKEVLVMPEFQDIHHVKVGEISVLTWIKDVIKTDRFMEFSKKDQKPFWMYFIKRFLKV